MINNNDPTQGQKAPSGLGGSAMVARPTRRQIFDDSGRYYDLITLAPKKLILTRRASEGSASEPSLARRVSMCKDAKLSCRGNITTERPFGCPEITERRIRRKETRLRRMRLTSAS